MVYGAAYIPVPWSVWDLIPPNILRSFECAATSSSYVRRLDFCRTKGRDRERLGQQVVFTQVGVYQNRETSQATTPLEEGTYMTQTPAGPGVLPLQKYTPRRHDVVMFAGSENELNWRVHHKESTSQTNISTVYWKPILHSRQILIARTHSAVWFKSMFVFHQQ